MIPKKEYREAMVKLIGSDPEDGVITTHLATVDGHVATHGIMNLISPYLSSKAKSLFSNKNNRIHNLIHQRNEKRPLYECVHEEIKNNFMLLVKNITTHKKTIYDDWTHYVRVCDIVEFFGIHTDIKNLNTAVIRLAAVINSLAYRGAITGVLAEPMLLPLYDPKEDFHSVAIVTYLSIHHKKAKRAKKDFKSIMFKEGGLPPKIK